MNLRRFPKLTLAVIKVNCWLLVRLPSGIKAGQVWREERFYDNNGRLYYVGAVFVPSGESWPDSANLKRRTFYYDQF